MLTLNKANDMFLTHQRQLRLPSLRQVLLASPRLRQASRNVTTVEATLRIAKPLCPIRMKLLLSLLFIFNLIILGAQTINSSVKEIEGFVNNRISDNQTFTLLSDKDFLYDSTLVSTLDSLRVKYFNFGDFDNNGQTDLMAFGTLSSNTSPVVLIGLKFDTTYSFKKINLRDGLYTTSFPQIATLNSKSVLKIVSHVNLINDPSICWPPCKPKNKTIYSQYLIYKFDSFVEYNPNPSKHRINKIEYSTSMCFGECPVFSLIILPEEIWSYKAIAFNKKNGEFKSKPNQELFIQVEEFLNYLDFENLDSLYSVNWTDDQTATLRIFYDENKIVEIRDYGLRGTFGLIKLHHWLFEFRDNHKWKRKI